MHSIIWAFNSSLFKKKSLSLKISLLLSRLKKWMWNWQKVRTHKYFTNQELVGLVTSNFYSVLSYNLEVWHIALLKFTLKQQLLSASARAFKVCVNNPDPMISFVRIHEINKRGLPKLLMTYKHSLLLHKLYNL